MVKGIVCVKRSVDMRNASSELIQRISDAAGAAISVPIEMETLSPGGLFSCIYEGCCAQPFPPSKKQSRDIAGLSVLDGHHRLTVLIERGEDINEMDREIIEREP